MPQHFDLLCLTQQLLFSSVKAANLYSAHVILWCCTLQANGSVVLPIGQAWDLRLLQSSCMPLFVRLEVELLSSCAIDLVVKQLWAHFKLLQP